MLVKILTMLITFIFTMNVFASEFSQNSLITFVKGRVLIHRKGKVNPAGKKKFSKARKGMAINIGDELKTDRRSLCELKLANSSVVSLKEKSHFLIPTDQSNTSQRVSKVKMIIGDAMFNVKKLVGKQKYEVETPSSIAGVRGTSFIMAIAKSGVTKCTGLSGKVGFRSLADVAGKAVRIVTKGYQTMAKVGKIPTKLMKVDLTKIIKTYKQFPSASKTLSKVTQQAAKQAGKQATKQAANQAAKSSTGSNLAKTGLKALSAFDLGYIAGNEDNYLKIAWQPKEFSFWKGPYGDKFGVKLDLSFYFDLTNTEFKTDNWDDMEDYFNKIIYMRFNKKSWVNDKSAWLYMKGGRLENSYLGAGNIISNYRNFFDDPTQDLKDRKVGAEFQFDIGMFGIEAMVDDVKDATILAARPYMRPFKILSFLPLIPSMVTDSQLGFTMAMDQKIHTKDYYPETLGGMVNGPYSNTSYSKIKSLTENPDYEASFMTDIARDSLGFKDELIIVGIDFIMPLFNWESFNTKFYVAAAQIADFGEGADYGFKGKLFVLDYNAYLGEYNHNYINRYFDSFYDLERTDKIKRLAYIDDLSTEVKSTFNFQAGTKLPFGFYFDAEFEKPKDTPSKAGDLDAEERTRISIYPLNKEKLLFGKATGSISLENKKSYYWDTDDSKVKTVERKLMNTEVRYKQDTYGLPMVYIIKRQTTFDANGEQYDSTSMGVNFKF